MYTTKAATDSQVIPSNIKKLLSQCYYNVSMHIIHSVINILYNIENNSYRNYNSTSIPVLKL
jgi:hypothetical protein